MILLAFWLSEIPLGKEQLITTELAPPTWYKSPTCYHLNKDESTTKKYFGVQGECFGEGSFWLGGFWVGVVTSLILLNICDFSDGGSFLSCTTASRLLK